MGVINLTPDSFSDGGDLNSSKKVLDQVNHFLSNGVDAVSYTHLTLPTKRIV